MELGKLYQLNAKSDLIGAVPINSEDFKKCRLKNFSCWSFVPEIPQFAGNLWAVSGLDAGMCTLYAGEDNVDVGINWKYEPETIQWTQGYDIEYSSANCAIIRGCFSEVFGVVPSSLANLFKPVNGDEFKQGVIQEIEPSDILKNMEFYCLSLDKFNLEQVPHIVGLNFISQYGSHKVMLAKNRITNSYDYYLIIPTMNGQPYLQYARLVNGFQFFNYFDIRSFSKEMKPYTDKKLTITRCLNKRASSKAIQEDIFYRLRLNYKCLDFWLNAFVKKYGNVKLESLRNSPCKQLKKDLRFKVAVPEALQKKLQTSSMFISWTYNQDRLCLLNDKGKIIATESIYKIVSDYAKKDSSLYSFHSGTNTLPSMVYNPIYF